MPVSLSSPAAAPPREAHGRQQESAHNDSAHPAAGHEHASHSHQGHDHSAHGRKPQVRMGASVLRMSLAARLGVVAVLLAILWGAVLLVTGSGA